MLQGQGSNDSYPDVDPSSGRSRPPLLFRPLVLFGLAALFFGVGFLAYILLVSSSDGQEIDGPAAPATTVDGSDGESGDGDNAARADSSETDADQVDSGEDLEAGGATTTTPDDDAIRLPTSTIEGAYVEASLDLDAGPTPGMFQLSGIVPDQETADALMQSAELSYAPFATYDLVVDESLPAAPWLASAPTTIGLLPTITDGTLRYADGEVELLARSPNDQYLAFLVGALNQVSGLPVNVSETTITDLVPPKFVATFVDDELTLTGEVPSEEIITILAGGAAQVYGEDNVTSELTINDDTYISFWMFSMPGAFGLMLPFEDYELRVIDGAFSGRMQGGANFAVDSTAVSPALAELLNVGVAIMSRDLSISMTIEGHTDSTGSETHNLALSEGRANSVVDYFVAAGIDPSRLTALGLGESRPLASNDTDAGKATNRRVEFDFGFAAPG